MPPKQTTMTTADKMSALLARISPIPAFPSYTGPYKVGTMDVEIPVSDLDAPSAAPVNAADIPTVQFRVFYPAVDESDQTNIPWLPTPQRHYVSAYTKFVGIGNMLAELLSFLPRHLNYATIPVHKNATLRKAETEDGTWPTMIFSHGLGGSRNSYSYIAGSLASHGVVVICPEHRDGSAVISFIRVPADSSIRRSVPYVRISHDVSPEVYEAREAQLRIRLWEVGLIHDAIQRMNDGTPFKNLNATTPSLAGFKDTLRVQEPGSIIFAGHSFGAATMVQLLKSTYYADHPDLAAMENPLFTPAKDSAIRKQVTERTVTMLLDMWCMPLLAPNSAALYDFPLPLYDDRATAAGGAALLAVESEAFFKWKEHLHLKARLLSPDPKAKKVSPSTYERPSGIKMSEPNFFYVVNSAHLSQSDFGILFPWLTKKIFEAEQPERALRLNLRAQLQFLRTNGVPVARTFTGDLIDGAHVDKLDSTEKSGAKIADGLDDDKAIFDRSGNNIVEYWKWIDIIGMGEAEETGSDKSVSEQVESTDEKMKGEMEPREQSPPPIVRTLSAAAA